MILSLHTNNNFLSPDEIILYQLQKPEHRIEQTFSALMFLHAGLGYTLFNTVINRLVSFALAGCVFLVSSDFVQQTLLYKLAV